MIVALLTLLALVLTWAAFDYAGFGLVMTRQRWGDPKQRRAWESLPVLAQGTYRVVQHAFIFASAYFVATFGGPFLVGAIMAVAAFGFMPQDIGYHLVGGHFGHEHYNPFSMGEKVKKYSLHYWPIRWYVKSSPSLAERYPLGVPAKYETWGRIIGTIIAVTTVAISI